MRNKDDKMVTTLHLVYIDCRNTSRLVRILLARSELPSCSWRKPDILKCYNPCHAIENQSVAVKKTFINIVWKRHRQLRKEISTSANQIELLWVKSMITKRPPSDVLMLKYQPHYKFQTCLPLHNSIISHTQSLWEREIWGPSTVCIASKMNAVVIIDRITSIPAWLINPETAEYFAYDISRGDFYWNPSRASRLLNDALTLRSTRITEKTKNVHKYKDSLVSTAYCHRCIREDMCSHTCPGAGAVHRDKHRRLG